MIRKSLLQFTALVVLTTLTLGIYGGALAVNSTPSHVSETVANSAALPIESTYSAPGPWAVSTATADDGLGHTFHLWYPTDLGADGYLHPILTWGNGTYGWPDYYADTLDHMASWGFVVIASDSGQTGLGIEIVAGANYMIAENDDPASVFYHKLATDRVGVLGHSQGGCGIINAVFLAPTLFKSALTNGLPNPNMWAYINLPPPPDMTQWPTSVPIWFTRGTEDIYAFQYDLINWYNAVPGRAARGSLIGVEHKYIHETNNAFQGYFVAWFKYTLEGDTYARGAFTGYPPELNANTAWQDQAVKGFQPTPPTPSPVGGIAQTPPDSAAGASNGPSDETDHSTTLAVTLASILGAAAIGAGGWWSLRKRWQR